MARGWERSDVDRVLAKQGVQAKPSKYHAQAVIYDNIRFDSKKEGARYLELKAMQHALQIIELRVQPKFELWAWVLDNGGFGAQSEAHSVGYYVADFSYLLADGKTRIIEDVKSPATRTPLYKLKRAIAEACHGITITEV